MLSQDNNYMYMPLLTIKQLTCRIYQSLFQRIVYLRLIRISNLFYLLVHYGENNFDVATRTLIVLVRMDFGLNDQLSTKWEFRGGLNILITWNTLMFLNQKGKF